MEKIKKQNIEPIIINTNDLLRIVILNIKDLFSEIYDEAYLPQSELENFISQYNNENFRIIII